MGNEYTYEDYLDEECCYVSLNDFSRIDCDGNWDLLQHLEYFKQDLWNDSTIDIETREHFNVMDFSFFCEDCYSPPNPEEVEMVLKKTGYQDIDKLCSDMTNYYNRREREKMVEEKDRWIVGLEEK